MHTLRTDDQAVSPVIGVILMVAITVLLAATAAVFFFNLSGEQNQGMAPTVVFDDNYDPSGSSDVLTFEHSSGDNVRVGDLTVVVSDADPNSINKRYDVESITSYGAESRLTGGSTIRISSSSLPTVSPGNTIDLSKATVKIVWDGEGTTQSRTLQTWTGPKA